MRGSEEKYELRPITLRMAQAFVREHHRHNEAPQGHKFSIGLWVNGELAGVAIVGRPIARTNDDGITAEVTRCCVLGGKRNGSSLLYAAAWRAAKGMGYKRIDYLYIAFRKWRKPESDRFSSHHRYPRISQGVEFPGAASNNPEQVPQR